MGRKPKKKKPKQTDRMEKTTALVKEGYSLKMAMKLAGYARSTIEKRSAQYLRMLNLDELKKGLRVQSAVSSLKAFRVLDKKMTKAEKDGDQIKAADAVLRSGKTYLGPGEAPTTLAFIFQTFKDTPENPGETIDVTPKIGGGDES